MARRLILSVLLVGALGACQSPTGPSPAPSGPANAGNAAFVIDAEAPRLLVEGAFSLPAQLVSVGTGNLVSTGSGGLVSTGSAQYQTLVASAEQAVPGAQVRLTRLNGAEAGVASVVTDARGRFQVLGRLSPGVYRLEAKLGDQVYVTLIAVQSADPVQAPIDLATTLVATRLLSPESEDEQGVLPSDDYKAAVDTVRAALADYPLPNGWTPRQSEATLADLERRTPAVREATERLAAQRRALARRFNEMQNRLRTLATELGVQPGALDGEVKAKLSSQPKSSDAELTEQVRARLSMEAYAAQVLAAMSPKPGASPQATAEPLPGAKPTAPAPSPSGGAFTGLPGNQTRPTPEPLPVPPPRGNKPPVIVTPPPTPTPPPFSGPPTSGLDALINVVARPTPTPKPTPTPTPKPTATPGPWYWQPRR